MGDGKNVLQFLLISAHNQIQSNWVSRCKWKLIVSHETAPLFLYNPMKTATFTEVVTNRVCEGLDKNNLFENYGLLFEPA